MCQSGSVIDHSNKKGRPLLKITTVGVDLAKNIFQIHGVNEHGKAVLRKQVRREQLAAFFANLPPCLIGFEACGGAHHWARKLMAPQFVKPYVKANKTDAADAEAICEAVSRPSMRFVPLKVTTRVTTSFKANGVVPGRGGVRGWQITARQPTACAALPKLA
jgi:hypothetical protein